MILYFIDIIITHIFSNLNEPRNAVLISHIR